MARQRFMQASYEEKYGKNQLEKKWTLRGQKAVLDKELATWQSFENFYYSTRLNVSHQFKE